MSRTFRDVRRNIDQTLEYQNLKRQLDNLPGQARDFVRNNFSGLEGAQMVTDITGMFEPTPFSDIAGAIIGVVRGDWLSVGTSLLGIIPYVGDLGKVGKWAKRAVTAPKYGRMVKFVHEYTNIKRKIAVLSQTKALQRTRTEMWDYYQRSLRGDNCQLCRTAASKVKLPTHGTFSGVRGNSNWFPNDATNLSDAVKDQINRNGGVPFIQGMPDYSAFARELPGGIRTMPMEMSGGARDLRNAWKQYGDMLDAEGNGLSRAAMQQLKDTNVWHHTAEGMQMVPKALHNITNGGPSHVGSRSWLSWPTY
jgi:hypothetical protein